MPEPLHTIENQAALRAAIKEVKQRITAGEQALEERWNKVPEESIKATLGLVLPVFMNSRLAAGTWRVMKGAFRLLAGKTDEQGGFKEGLFSGARQLSVFAVLKFLYNLWTGRKKGA